jgi:cytochrome c-type biogenesis protein CcmE
MWLRHRKRKVLPFAKFEPFCRTHCRKSAALCKVTLDLVHLTAKTMSSATQKSPIKIVIAAVIIIATMGYLAYTGVQDNKSYYVTIGELQAMGNKAYVRHLRVAGNVAPRSIHRSGTYVDFALLEQNRTLKVSYKGVEPPPDTFKDDAQALAVGTYGHDGVFHATQLQAKCASKYAPAKPATPTTTAAALPADFKK